MQYLMNNTIPDIVSMVGGLVASIDGWLTLFSAGTDWFSTNPHEDWSSSVIGEAEGAAILRLMSELES